MTIRTHLIAAVACLALAAGSPALAQELPRGRVDWLGDLGLAMEEAAVTRRPVLLTFYTTWCGWCRKLEGHTFQDARFVEFSQHVVPVRVDGDRERGLAAMYRVTGYPTTLLISRQGREIVRIAGYKPPEDFLRYMTAGLERRELLAETLQYVEENPGDPWGRYALGEVYLALQRFEDARRTYTELIGMEGKEADELADDARLDIALTYLFNYDFAGALPLLERFLEMHPDSERRDQGLFFHGLALLRTGRTEEGLARLGEAEAETMLEYIKYETQRLRKQVEQEQGQG